MLSTLRSSALRGGRRYNAPASMARLAFVQPFSSTPRYNVNALFTMTENEELNPLLREIQDKIILPAYLPEKNRRVVFDPQKKQYLEQNPIDIEVEGYEHRFKHINPHKDIPKTKDITDQAIGAMKTREDFDNLGTLLAGLAKAGQRLSYPRTAKLVRHMTAAGQMGALIGCLKQFKQTGLTIRNKEVLVKVYLGLIGEANKAKGNVEQLQQIQRWSEMVQDVIQRPEHDALIAPFHSRVAYNVAQRLEYADEELKKELFLIFSASSKRDLVNSVFGRSLSLYIRLLTVQAKQDAGQDVEADMVQINDEIETVSNLWHERQIDGTDGFDMTRVTEALQLCPSLYPRGNLERWHNKATCNDLAFTRLLGQTYNALKQAEIMSPTQAQGLTVVANSIPSYAAKLLQISKARHEGKQEHENVGKGREHREQVFKEITGIDLLAIAETLPPLENHRTAMSLDAALLNIPEGVVIDLDETPAVEEEVKVEAEVEAEKEETKA